MLLQSYLKVAVRNLLRFRAFALISLLGLSSGLAAVIVVGAHIASELGYDEHWPNSDRTYRVTMKTRNQRSGIERATGTTLHSVAPSLSVIPGVECVARAYQRDIVFKIKSELFRAKGFYYADPELLQIFPHRILKGDPKTSLSRPNSLMLTASLARTLFGDEDPVGKVLLTTRGPNVQFFVTGIIDDPTQSSHFQFDALASMQTRTKKLRGMDDKGYLTYLKTSNSMSVQELNEQILSSNITRQYGTQEFDYFTQPIVDVHLDPALPDDPAIVGDVDSLYLLTCLAMALLLVAVTNHVTLSTARFTDRARELGIRKLLGATRSGMFGQLLAETGILVTVSFLLALAVVGISGPWLRDIVGISIHDGIRSELAWISSAAIVSIALLSGLYPTIFLSTFSITDALRGRLTVKAGAVSFRRALMGFQMATAVMLLVVSGIIAQQLEFIGKRGLGFNSRPLITAEVGLSPQLRAELLNDSTIIGVSGSADIPGMMSTTSLGRFAPEGIVPGKEEEMMSLGVDYDFLAVFDLELVAGRWFSDDFPSDSTGAYVVNEAAAKALGWDDPVGKGFRQLGYPQRADRNSRVIGVVRDFHVSSLRNTIEPLVLYPSYIPGFGYLGNWTTVRVDTTDYRAATSAFKDILQRFVSYGVPEIRQVDGIFWNLYQEERRITFLAGICGYVTIVLVVLGVFALVAFSVERRAREISLRRILGGSITRVSWCLTRDIGVVALVASAAGCGASAVVTNEWLMGFAYRVSLGPVPFLLSGAGLVLLVVGVSGLTVASAIRRRASDTLRE